MPTKPLSPIPAPKNEEEEEAKAREDDVEFVRRFVGLIRQYSYITRSYMPNKIDYTNFIDWMAKLTDFCEKRPDWTLDILKRIEVGKDKDNYEFWMAN